MFLSKYVNCFYYEEILENYNKNFLETMDEGNFKQVYKVFAKYKFYFLEDVILKYLELFTCDSVVVEEKLKEMIIDLGEDYLIKMGNDMRYFGKLFRGITE